MSTNHSKGQIKFKRWLKKNGYRLHKHTKPTKRWVLTKDGKKVVHLEIEGKDFHHARLFFSGYVQGVKSQSND